MSVDVSTCATAGTTAAANEAIATLAPTQTVRQEPRTCLAAQATKNATTGTTRGDVTARPANAPSAASAASDCRRHIITSHSATAAGQIGLASSGLGHS